MPTKTATWLIISALTTTFLWACGDDDDGPPIGMAGSGGKSAGGTGGTAGKAGSSGLGGAGAGSGGGGASSCDESGSDCPFVDACGPVPLAELCAARPNACPDEDELDYAAWCERGTRVTSRETTCGGRVVVADYGLGTDTWGFDASGTLEYKRLDSDVVRTCSDGKGVSASIVWGGLSCAATGAASDLCGEDGSGGSGGDGGSGGAGGQGGAGGGE